MFPVGVRIKYKHQLSSEWSKGGTVVSCPEKYKFIDTPDKIWGVWDELTGGPYHISTNSSQVELENPIDIGDMEDDL